MTDSQQCSCPTDTEVADIEELCSVCQAKKMAILQFDFEEVVDDFYLERAQKSGKLQK